MRRTNAAQFLATRHFHVFCPRSGLRLRVCISIGSEKHEVMRVYYSPRTAPGRGVSRGECFGPEFNATTTPPVAYIFTKFQILCSMENIFLETVLLLLH